MTELIPGKQYRFTGRVTVDSDGTIDCDWGVYDAYTIDDDPDVTVELIEDPLPVTPGSVIRSNNTTYLRQADSFWVGAGGAGVNDEIIRRRGFIVLFDASAK